MSAITELEAQLRAAWDLEAAAVYADALQAAGDARGELIALDLEIAARGATPVLVAARRAAVERWLGDAVGHWPLHTVQFGMLDVMLASDAHSTIDDRADALLGSPGGRYVRQVTIVGDARGVSRALIRLAAQPLPWLERLVIDQTERGLAPRGLVTALAAAAPYLRSLELRGDRVMAAPLPASVRRLALHGHALVVGRTPVRGVTELDLVLDVPDATALRGLAPLVDAFADLQRLDLSRNEASYPSDHPRNVDPLALVGLLKRRDRLRTLRLPALRSVEQRGAIRALLDRHPRLAIDVARSYRAFAELVAGLRHPRLHIAPPRPWPPAERISGLDGLAVSCGERTQTLALAYCAEVLEAVFDELAAPARDAWTAVWTAIEDLPGDEPIAFPAAILAAAVGAIPAALDVRCADIADLLRGASTVQLVRRALVSSHRGKLALERARIAAPQRDHLARPGVGEDLVDIASDVF